VTAEVFANMVEARRLAYEAWDRILTLGEAPASAIAATCQQISAAQQST
jgi:hypothetical protein